MKVNEDPKGPQGRERGSFDSDLSTSNDNVSNKVNVTATRR